MAQVTGSFTGNIINGGPLTMTPAIGTIPTLTEGVTVDEVVCEITGGVSPYAIDPSSSTPPSGLTLGIVMNVDGSGSVVLSGTPQAGTGGGFSLSISVNDSA